MLMMRGQDKDDWRGCGIAMHKAVFMLVLRSSNTRILIPPHPLIIFPTRTRLPFPFLVCEGHGTFPG